MATENSIEPLIQSYAVDFASANNFLFVKGIQGDGHSTRYVDITLLNESQPYEVNSDAVDVVIRGIKPDNKTIFNECEIIDSNTIRVEITQQMSAVVGKGNYEISIMDKTENRTLTSFPFFIMISKSSFDVGYVVSSDEFGFLIEKINTMNKLEVDISDIIEESISQTAECKNATDDSIEATENLRNFHTTAEQAENIRNQNEIIRQQNTEKAISDSEEATTNATNQTNIMKQLESDINTEEQKRIDAESERAQQSIDFENEENIRKENETQRINAENKRQLDTQNALKNANSATTDATNAALYANSVGNDLTQRLNNGEFNGKDGKDGKDGIVHTISGQYAFQIIDDDLYMFYTDGDEPLNLEIDTNGYLILTIE